MHRLAENKKRVTQLENDREEMIAERQRMESRSRAEKEKMDELVYQMKVTKRIDKKCGTLGCVV
jgi:hypothetical protein